MALSCQDVDSVESTIHFFNTSLKVSFLSLFHFTHKLLSRDFSICIFIKSLNNFLKGTVNELDRLKMFKLKDRKTVIQFFSTL